MSMKRAFTRILRGWLQDKVRANGRLRYSKRTFPLIATVGTIVTLLTFQAPIPLVSASDSWIITLVDSPNVTLTTTSLALDASGNPSISYEPVWCGVKYARRSGSVWTLETVDSTDCAWASSLAIDATGNPHISYYDPQSGDLRYARKTDGSWTVETVDSIGCTADTLDDSQCSIIETSLALDAFGNPHITYQDWTNQDLRYAHKTGGTWTLETVDSAGDTGSWASLALDASDNPHISYYDWTNDSLRYAGKTGGVWTKATIDSGAGARTSIEVDSLGNPHISYEDWLNQDLRYASRTAGVWTNETVDSDGGTTPDGGAWVITSIDVDSSGNPHISYRGGAGDLRYARKSGDTWIKDKVDSHTWLESISLALDASDRPHISYTDGTQMWYALLNISQPNPSLPAPPIALIAAIAAGITLLMLRRRRPR